MLAQCSLASGPLAVTLATGFAGALSVTTTGRFTAARRVVAAGHQSTGGSSLKKIDVSDCPIAVTLSLLSVCSLFDFTQLDSLSKQLLRHSVIDRVTFCC